MAKQTVKTMKGVDERSWRRAGGLAEFPLAALKKCRRR
jgi:hypothetical protein